MPLPSILMLLDFAAGEPGAEVGGFIGTISSRASLEGEIIIRAKLEGTIGAKPRLEGEIRTHGQL